MEIKLFLFLGSLLATFGVAFGAVGSHLLKERLMADKKEPFEIGVRFQLIHALAIFVIALSYPYVQNEWIPFALWMMVLGTILFSGSLYLYALTRRPFWAFITPWGGTLLILSWILYTLAVVKT